MNGVEPYAYLRDLFTHLANGHLAQDIDTLMPWAYANQTIVSQGPRPGLPGELMARHQAADRAAATKRSMGRSRRIPWDGGPRRSATPVCATAVAGFTSSSGARAGMSAPRKFTAFTGHRACSSATRQVAAQRSLKLPFRPFARARTDAGSEPHVTACRCVKRSSCHSPLTKIFLSCSTAFQTSTYLR